MTAIPLPTGIVGDTDIPELQEYLVNLFNPGDNTLLKTPGQSSLTTGEGFGRGAIDFQNEHYQVSGSSLIKVAQDGTVTVIGTISGTADVVMAASFIALNIIVKGGAGYSFSPSGGLVLMTGSFKPSRDITAINSRFVYIPFDGGPAFFTDVNVPADIPSLNFFDAEFLPDINTGCKNLSNDLYILGLDSSEVFRDIGPSNAPFVRVDSAAIETGFIGGGVNYRDTFVFLGKDKGGSFAFHAMGSGDAPKISNPAIDELINEEYTQEELFDVTAQRFTWKGVDMVAFRLARHSLLFYGAGWSYIQSGIDGDDEFQPWDVNHLAFSYGKYITCSATSNKIGILGTELTEFGNKIERQIATFIKGAPNSYFLIDNLFLSCITGTAATSGTIGLSISEDGIKYGPTKFRSLGKQGQTKRQVVWYGGIGPQHESFCGIKLRTTADVNFSTEGVFFNG